MHPLLVVISFAVIAYLAKKAIDAASPALPYNEPITDNSEFPASAPISQASATQTSQQGRDNIANFEGVRYAAYSDIGGNLTIGIGHLIHPGDGLNAQSVLTDTQVMTLFGNDLANAENTVKTYVTVPLSQGQFDALVDFVFNVGVGAFASSSLLKLINARYYDVAADEFKKWIYAGKQILPGLVTRREADANLWLYG